VSAVPGGENATLRVLVDRDACVGHGRCYSLAPGVFAPDDEGFVELVDEVVPATDELRRQARLGVQTCPERALGLQEG
jgi:ferredoxin